MEHPGEENDVNPMLLRPEEAAETLGISRSRFYELMASGAIKTVTIGRSRRVTVGALEEFVAQLEGEAGDAA